MKQIRVPSSASALTVRTAPLHTDVTIGTIHLDERHRFRMLELGLRTGTPIRIIQKANFGGRVIAKGYERIAIDGATAAAIEVNEVSAQEQPEDTQYTDPGHQTLSPADRCTAQDWTVLTDANGVETSAHHPADFKE